MPSSILTHMYLALPLHLPHLLRSPHLTLSSVHPLSTHPPVPPVQAEGGVQLAFTDARRFGRIRLAPDPLLCPPVAQLGPDVLLSLPDPASFAALLRRRSRAVKALLMDQAVLSGIGNWLADEVLYQ
ncbi:unnamed protein product, partial [Closterium sp. NIES-53]